MAWMCFELLIGWLLRVPSNAEVLRGIAATIVLCWCLLLSGLVGALVVFHCYLIAINKTTSEFFRDRKRRSTFNATATVTATANSKSNQLSWFTAAAQRRGLFGDTPGHTKLLPLWQFESVEDIFLQDDLTELVLDKYLSMQQHRASIPELPPVSPPSITQQQQQQQQQKQELSIDADDVFVDHPSFARPALGSHRCDTRQQQQQRREVWNSSDLFDLKHDSP
jgi:hypothetical protein